MYRCDEYEDGVYESIGYTRKRGDEEEEEEEERRSPPRSRGRYRTPSPHRQSPSEDHDCTGTSNEVVVDVLAGRDSDGVEKTAEGNARRLPRHRFPPCPEFVKWRRDPTYSMSGAIPLPRLSSTDSTSTSEIRSTKLALLQKTSVGHAHCKSRHEIATQQVAQRTYSDEAEDATLGNARAQKGLDEDGSVERRDFGSDGFLIYQREALGEETEQDAVDSI
jgi:hypothetical protein